MIALLQKFQHILPRHSLLTMYKTFVRPHLDCGDVIYDRVSVIVLAMTGAIRGTNIEKLYQKLGLESLQNRRKLRSLYLLYNICKHYTPPYLHKLIP